MEKPRSVRVVTRDWAEHWLPGWTYNVCSGSGIRVGSRDEVAGDLIREKLALTGPRWTARDCVGQHDRPLSA